MGVDADMDLEEPAPENSDEIARKSAEISCDVHVARRNFTF